LVTGDDDVGVRRQSGLDERDHRRDPGDSDRPRWVDHDGTEGHELDEASASPMTACSLGAHLCGVAPLPASSGKRADRDRLNKGGDRDANCAPHMSAVNRLSRCERTRAYVQKRSPDGKADLDILRGPPRAMRSSA
jgi:hypothetical protein